MARLARVVAVGVPHHLTQRGNNRQPTFFHDDDRLNYCRLLALQCAREGVRLLGYCLMTNHVHFVAIPERPDSFARGLGRTHYLYTRAVHERWGGSLVAEQIFLLSAGPRSSLDSAALRRPQPGAGASGRRGGRVRVVEREGARRGPRRAGFARHGSVEASMSARGLEGGAGKDSRRRSGGNGAAEAGDGERASAGQRGVCRAIGGNFGAQIEPETHGTTQEGRRRGLARISRSLSPTFHVPDFPLTFLGDGERASTGQRGVCRAIGGNFGAQIEPETHGTTQEGRRRGLARKSRSLSPTFPRLSDFPCPRLSPPTFPPTFPLPGTIGSGHAKAPGEALRGARSDLSSKVQQKLERTLEGTGKRQQKFDEDTDHGRRKP